MGGEWRERLRELRERIDEADEKMLEAFRERMDACREIGRVKREAGLPVVDRDREREVLSRARSRWEEMLLRLAIEACIEEQGGRG
jgi:chorismate mutase